MTTSQDAEATTEEHAPREAWDAIADGYDRYVAPQEVTVANEALSLVGVKTGVRFLDVAAGTGVLAFRELAWAPRCSPPTGPPRRSNGSKRAYGKKD